MHEQLELAKQLQVEIIKRKKLVDEISKLTKMFLYRKIQMLKPSSIRIQVLISYIIFKLISLSCGIPMDEIETSIDAMEESLSKINDEQLYYYYNIMYKYT